MLIDNIFFPKLESSKNSKKIKKWGSLTYQSQGPVPLIDVMKRLGYDYVER